MVNTGMLDITRAYGLDFLVPANDTVIGVALRSFGEFARVEVDFICEHLERSQAGLFVDVGANLGAISVPVAKRNPSIGVRAFEAHRQLSQLCAANAFANDLANVDVRHLAIGDRQDVVDFPATTFSGDGNFGVLSLAKNHGLATERTMMERLDDLDLKRVRLIKIDVEGFEPNVLAGAAELLKTQQPVVTMEARSSMEDEARRSAAQLRAHGYRLFWLFSPFVTATPLKRFRTRPGNTGDMSIVALPEGVDNHWGLPEVAADRLDWPRFDSFLYLRRYGF